ncbi:TadE/TadG family type IV pilus assembly protein [Lentzea cavernae]|uniref:Membrane protein n=1 Tax=Lentzea cavernae TaxID=2020703 RepID=A0ABQ3M5W3_9PSEU|nr:TadE/TadG family type IV pilus assembly protein [Lentzea cavernae]GHH32158.1 membrane protein [Lentzea cavernae]
MSWWRDQRGSAAAEVALWAPIMVMALVFVAVVVHRGVDARLRLNDVAHQAARAASIEHTNARAVAEATAVATQALAGAGISCRGLNVEVGGLRPGAMVTVTVSCTVDLSGGALLGVPAAKRLSSTASEVVDAWRSEGSGT